MRPGPACVQPSWGAFVCADLPREVVGRALGGREPAKTLLLSPADRRDVVATQLPLSSKGTWLRAGAGAECDIGRPGPLRGARRAVGPRCGICAASKNSSEVNTRARPERKLDLHALTLHIHRQAPRGAYTPVRRAATATRDYTRDNSTVPPRPGASRRIPARPGASRRVPAPL